MADPKVITEEDRARFSTRFTRGPGCWIWTAGKCGGGYGALVVAGTQVDAHRLSWMVHRGPIPRGMWVLHRCDVRACVNPDHLWLGTRADNDADRVVKGRSASGDANGARTHPESRQRGDAHWSRRHPERLARGDKSGARLHPETRPRGDANGARTHPECVPRGAAHGRARLTEADVIMIRASTETQCALARRFGVGRSTIVDIVRRRTWRHV